MRIPILAILIFSVIALAQNNVTTAFYGSADAEEGATLYAYAGEKQFVTKVSEGKYGYSPPFEVSGTEGEKVSFYIGDELIAESALEGGMKKLNLGEEEEPVEEELAEKTEQVALPAEVTAEKESSALPVIMIILAAAALAFLLYLFLRPKKAKYNMRLYMYLQDLLARGYTKEQLTSYLKQQGWDEKTLDATFKKLGK